MPNYKLLLIFFELSLEIGKDSLGYYCDGKFKKFVDEIDITSVENIYSAVSIIENDINLSVNKKLIQ